MKDLLAPLGIIVLGVVAVQLTALLFSMAPGGSMIAALWGMHCRQHHAPSSDMVGEQFCAEWFFEAISFD